MNVSRVDLILGPLWNAGKLFYLVNPCETIFQFPGQVPDYQRQVWLPFFVLIVLEQLILATKRKKFRLNDQMTSLSHWLLHESGRILSRGAEYYTYIVIHEKYHWWSLPWDSAWTWWITAVGVDFCYYWVHRSNHEVHFLWSHHQVHHSSEEFTLAVGLRQSVLQHWCNFMFYLPLAFVLPPSHFIVHNQFNLIYQLWIHTTVIDDLGPLEFIFNTPKHHRVHHGCNLYCLDKNYGGVLIVWDKLFGTFAEERKKEDIIYGLVVSPESFNPLYLQTFYSMQLIQRSLQMRSLTDKLAVVWKGPSWFPGGPRLGLDERKINVTSRTLYDNAVPAWQGVYAVLHFCVALFCHLQLYDAEGTKTMPAGWTIANNLFALTTIGLLFDKSRYASVMELIRCIVYLSYSTVYNSINVYIYSAHVASCCVWVLYFLSEIRSCLRTVRT
ncbi:alkylglycerol monooxygenase [Megalopta genalis]|uniref:alkylglycerol monooxygenase n=1 Tax=Megalopta genalis TaxID=115081 RepID=UPI0014432047|nr:alkylglycerol monooxygenase-like [Megalopta genalis]